MGRTSINMTDEREELLDAAKKVTNESTNSGAIDRGLEALKDLHAQAEEVEQEIQTLVAVFNDSQSVYELRVSTDITTQSND